MVVCASLAGESYHTQVCTFPSLFSSPVPNPQAYIVMTMLLMDRALKPNWLVPVLIVDIDGVIDRTVGTKAKDQETATRSPRAHPDACPLSQRRQCQAGFAQTFWASRFDFHPERRICFEATDPSYSSIAEQRTETREFLWKKQDYCWSSFETKKRKWI